MTAISQVVICRMALSHIGSDEGIENIDEEVPAAQGCKLWYDYSRLQVLRAYDWDFARKRIDLAAHADDPPADWAYRYQYPVDCVMTREIINPVGRTADATPFTLEVSADGTQRTILTDLEAAVLRYTFDQELVSVFDPTFVEALSYALAAHISYALTGNRTLKGDMLNIANAVLTMAGTENANARVEDVPRDADWVRNR